MEWEQLLGTQRYSTSSTAQPPTSHPKSGVSVFGEDAERILYSSPFRRMQGKTQVHPLPISDYLRTRLTHTIEVAHAGRLIATACAKRLKNELNVEVIDPVNIGDIVYAACLAHDLGNPPFGHIGEYAIQTWFKRASEKFDRVGKLFQSNHKHDFEYFDGNAQGFRILTRLSGWRHTGGLQLSHATIGAFSKYPNSSKWADSSHPKFGFHHDDERAAQSIFKSLGLVQQDENKWCRHPLAYIVEAADDICYLTTDIEDACRIGLVTFTSASDLLQEIGDTGNHLSRYNQVKSAGEPDRIAYLRAGAVSALIDGACDTFFENQSGIMAGTFTGEVLRISQYKDNISKIRETCYKIVYKDEDKLRVEAAGYNIIMTLMDLFGGMIEQFIPKGEGGLDRRNSGIYDLLPKTSKESLRQNDEYRSYLVLVDYISGMTDRFALDLFQKMTGSSVSLGRMT